MFTPQPLQLNLRAQRGQSIVVALLVLLILGLVGSLFVTVVARNILNANKSVRIQTAGQYAHAGITYADIQLSSSADGADWRPPLQFQLAVPPTEARELARYNAVKATLTDPTVAPYKDDPDLTYLVAGFARYNTGAGRYLVRVTYTPIMLKDKNQQYYDPIVGVDATGAAIAPVAVPPGKYLKIEAIGREGVIDPNDPTTYGNNRSSDRTQATLVAYKPIGITDYARFETNPDRRSDIANLGVASQYYANSDGSIATPGVFDFVTVANSNPPVPQSPLALSEYPIATTYGAVDAYLQKGTGIYPNPSVGTVASGYTAVPGGGSIHSNMPVRFFGENLIYLNTGGASPLYQDTAEIGGDLLLDSYDSNVNLDNTTIAGKTPKTYQAASLILNPPATGTKPLANYVAPSNGSFDTHGGLVRDGSMQNDPAGLPRSITRLEPPVLDAQDPASQMPRYRAIAMNSPVRNDPATGSAYVGAVGVSPSQYGYGKAIYVNNPNDVQTDSAAIGGGSTLTDEWLHRTAGNPGDHSKGDWNGLFYNPPGVTIVLGQRMTTTVGAATTTAYGIRLTRSVDDRFQGPDGTAATSVMDATYSDLDSETANVDLDKGVKPDNDTIIYAEGNVRVRGIASPNEGTGNSPSTQKYIPRHITIVTNGTAYIEGNLLKGDPDSSISVLAHDYVCVNTTQFLAGSVVGVPLPTINGTSLELTDGYTLAQEFNFGFTNPGATTPQTPITQYGANNLALYVAGSSSTPEAQADFNILDSNGISVFSTPPGLLMPVFETSTPTHVGFDLSNITLPKFTGTTGDSLFQLTVQKDPGNIPPGPIPSGQTVGNPPGSDPAAQQNPLLERVAVLPMDIRIEAVLYAQTRSFFVIPGESFNRNAADNLASYLSTGIRADLTTLKNPTPADQINVNRFPLYGQPIDLKITISGSVSEAHPADIAAQTAWMQKWGWIPQYHGSLIGSSPPAETAGHTASGQPAIGLQIIYDPLAGYPYDPAPAGNGTPPPYYLRSDQFGRPLPFTPKLPVSPGLLYAGQSGDAPLLQ